jgi:hypothetical protein
MLVIENIIKKVLNEGLDHEMRLTRKIGVSEELQYHLDNRLTLNENVFRIYSESYLNLINEVRNLYRLGFIELNENDKWIVISDLGKSVLSEEQSNYEDFYGSVENVDLLNEAEYQGRKVQLGKIMQGDVKKFKVYVKNDKGKVVKVNFGFGGKSAKGKRMVIKKNNPERRRSFRARHNCDNPGPRWKPRYWACKTW